MEFLNKLYESEYFIYIIGGVIAVLLILFLVILLSGKRKNKKEEVAETPVTNTSAIESATPASVSLTENLDETKEFKPEDLTDMSNVVVAVPPEETPTEEAVSTPIPEVVEEVPEATPAFTPEVEEPTPMEVIEPVETTPVVETPSEPLLRPQPNNQFSSVFVEDTRPATPLETPAVEPTPLEVAPIETINPEALAPAEPIAEEPKISFKVEAEELPKLNDENKEL